MFYCGQKESLQTFVLCLVLKVLTIFFPHCIFRLFLHIVKENVYNNFYGKLKTTFFVVLAYKSRN